MHDIRANKPLGLYEKKGDETAFFQKIFKAKIGSCNISVAVPNEISISLSIANKSIIASKELKARIEEMAGGEKAMFYESEEVGLAYDYLEEIQKAVVFSYKAVESFCNASIPHGYLYEKINNKGVKEIYGKEQIERWIKTSDKISEILPDVLGHASPVGEKFWSGFKNLERVRNEIVHSKSFSAIDILSELFSNDVENYVDSSLDLLDFFISKDPYNQIFPLGFGLSGVGVASCDEASEVIIYP